MDMNRLREYVRLRRQQSEREAEAAALKEAADDLEQLLLEDFSADSIQSIQADGMTVYLHRQLWAKVEDGVDRSQVVEALRAAGLGHFVTETFNSNTVSSWMRDLEREGDEMPEELSGLLAATEVYKLRTRRA